MTARPALSLLPLLGGLLLSGACDGADEAEPLSRATAQPVVPPQIAALVQPTKRYYLAHEGQGKCVLYWEDGDQRSPVRDVRCPRDLERGERIRLTGSTCIREAGSRDRSVPMRCPKKLVNLKTADLRDAGKLPTPTARPSH